ncbi:MAG: hypothetical protein ABW321_11440 [Polyangiales bacterium]
MRVAPGVTCLESERVVEHIATWLGTERVAAPLVIEVNGSPYFARTVWFRIRRGDATLAERRFEPAPERCDNLHAAVGLAIALALKASLLDSLIGVRTELEAQAFHPYRIGAHALGGGAVVPGLAWGLGLSLQRVLTDRFAARLSVLGVWGPRGDFAADQGRFTTLLTLGRLDVCSRLVTSGRVNISLCVGITAGALYATGEAFPMSRHALVPYFAVAHALELDLALSTRWSLALAIDVLVPVRRASFVVREQTGTVLAAHELAAAGALLALGPACHF